MNAPKIQKVRHFSQKQAEELSGITIMKLRNLNELGIVVPYKYPAILYSWKQVIFLRVIFYMRQRWSLKQIKNALTNLNEPIEQIINSLNEFITIDYGDFDDSNNLRIVFGDFSRFLHDDNEREMYKKNPQKPVKTDNFKTSSLDINEVIKELKQRGEDLNIENFDLKIE